MLLLFFFLSYLFLKYFGTVFCADLMPGAYVPSALAQILLLLGFMEQHSIGPEWLEVVVGSWEEQAGLAAFLGQEGDVGSAHPCVLLRGATPGPYSGKCLWNDQSLCRC